MPGQDESHWDLFNGPPRGGGGAIFQSGGVLALSECSFMRNTGRVLGGAIFHVYGQAMIDNCTFMENRALTGKGGAIAIANCDVPEGSGVHMSDITGLTHADDGISEQPWWYNAETDSAVAPDGTVAEDWTPTKVQRVSVLSSTFERNTASQAGGAIAVTSNYEGGCS
jgi:predicted outer membrane repeat protein